jgi:pimeloyl-ACP methyl ester carboxylesterase
MRLVMFLLLCVAVAAADGTASNCLAADDDAPAYGPQLQGFDYPWPVSHFIFTSQGESMDMAYMDVKPATAANGKTAVLFHGKNFCAATWQDTIGLLAAAGFRVIAVDQIGFCKVHVPATRRQHPCLAGVARHQPCNDRRSFDRRHAGHALRTDLSR